MKRMKTTVMTMAALSMLICTSAFAEKKVFEATATVQGTVSTTNNINTYVPATSFVEMSSFNFVVPATSTGTVTVATARAGNYVTVLSQTITNDTAAATQNFTGSLSIPVSGWVRVVISKTGASTNTWQYGLYFQD